MKLLSTLSLLLCLIIYSFTIPWKNSNKIKKPQTSASGGFAVVELFTSEGCSSCPPADKVLAKIQQEEDNQPVYILAYHVDYWNNSAWKDVFSSSEYSKRQSEYAMWLNLGSVYTPQIVVNGKNEFVGSQEATLRNEIKNNLAQNLSSSLKIAEITKMGLTINFKYFTQTSLSDLKLQVALVQKSGQTIVKRGENSGRTLSHIQIVRKFKTYVLSGKNNSNIEIDIPLNVKDEKLELIVFLQNMHTGHIEGATKYAL